MTVQGRAEGRGRVPEREGPARSGEGGTERERDDKPHGAHSRWHDRQTYAALAELGRRGPFKNPRAPGGRAEGRSAPSASRPLPYP
ncbi:hypothetical protein GCM10007890_05690 [Methylobacterium tardum]|uniref:Uncharacterized protein n=1 Tax=Methylobacterium tardum TaxID=374432 RepID=A0AA37TAY7_9HYPH|nr:hypothetical protein GCM10007890_05690 [Methylobacterium tardum]